jgi:hypothetical protein
VEAPPFPNLISGAVGCFGDYSGIRPPIDIDSIAADLIPGESDLDDCRPCTPDKVSLRTFKVKQNASFDDALNSLKAVSALPSDSDSIEVSYFLRRSSRKRKSR